MPAGRDEMYVWKAKPAVGKKTCSEIRTAVAGTKAAQGGLIMKRQART
jgi:hypothetical protein